MGPAIGVFLVHLLGCGPGTHGGATDSGDKETGESESMGGAFDYYEDGVQNCEIVQVTPVSLDFDADGFTSSGALVLLQLGDGEFSFEAVLGESRPFERVSVQVSLDLDGARAEFLELTIPDGGTSNCVDKVRVWLPMSFSTSSGHFDERAEAWVIETADPLENPSGAWGFAVDAESLAGEYPLPEGGGLGVVGQSYLGELITFYGFVRSPGSASTPEDEYVVLSGEID